MFIYFSGYKKVDPKTYLHPVIRIKKRPDTRNPAIDPRALSYIRSLLYQNLDKKIQIIQILTEVIFVMYMLKGIMV